MKKIILLLFFVCTFIFAISCGKNAISTPAYAPFNIADNPEEITDIPTDSETVAPEPSKRFDSFIVLTETNSKEVYVNINSIIFIRPSGDHSTIFLNGYHNTSIQVEETPEEIMKMLK